MDVHTFFVDYNLNYRRNSKEVEWVRHMCRLLQQRTGVRIDDVYIEGVRSVETVELHATIEETPIVKTYERDEFFTLPLQ